MNKEEYAQLHYLLAKIKYELYKIIDCEDINGNSFESIKNEIKAIDLVCSLCILGDSNG